MHAFPIFIVIPPLINGQATQTRAARDKRRGEEGGRGDIEVEEGRGGEGRGGGRGRDRRGRKGGERRGEGSGGWSGGGARAWGGCSVLITMHYRSLNHGPSHLYTAAPQQVGFSTAKNRHCSNQTRSRCSASRMKGELLATIEQEPLARGGVGGGHESRAVSAN